MLLATALVFCFVLAAIAGEQACALGGLGAALDRLSIGLGMIPRGEVGLIFANLGLSLTVHGERVVDPGSFSAVVIMVVAPSRAEQEARLRGRGDPEERVAQRLALAEIEEREGRELADHVVVNDDVGRALEELTGIVEACRRSEAR